MLIHHLKQVLQPEQVDKLREMAKTVRFVDGRVTNRRSRTKNNLQVPQDDPNCEEPGRIVRDALFRHPEFAQWAYPKRVARPTLSRYEVGMYYGRHCDEAVFASQPPMRSDASCTVFISEPEEYDGGDLVMHLGPERLKIKYAAGDAVLYPTDAVHEVTEVTRGARLVAITWIQSYIQDAKDREIMGRYDSLVRKLLPEADADTQMDFEYVRTNLFRKWADL
ncbi:MAG: Fe2+-dependent dioxygenase [Xanthomonadales bacterium]|nr:Fe2+-dependent dioxygenase [Xanthomonadales bacterium]